MKFTCIDPFPSALVEVNRPVPWVVGDGISMQMDASDIHHVNVDPKDLWGKTTHLLLWSHHGP